jgi:hypothetical protein
VGKNIDKLDLLLKVIIIFFYPFVLPGVGIAFSLCSLILLSFLELLNSALSRELWWLQRNELYTRYLIEHDYISFEEWDANRQGKGTLCHDSE